MKKRMMIIALVLLMTLPFAACASEEPTEVPTETGDLELTIEELSKYDGKDGNPAYIAVDGLIYDVSKVSFWANGMHNGFNAGNDLTEEIKNISPHGVSKLKGIPVVGTIVE